MNTETNHDENPIGSVTISLARKVVSGREADYEAWLKSISVEALKFPGHMGVNVIRPA